jgi:CcmD family protein
MGYKLKRMGSFVWPLSVLPLVIGAIPKANETGDNGLLFLFLAYTISWVVFFVYLLSISRKQRELIDELSALRQDISRESGELKRSVTSR